MIFLGFYKAGSTVKYRSNFHNDTGTLENPTSPAAEHESPSGTFTTLTAPAIVNSKTGHYGGSIDTTGFASGQHFVRMQGTVSTAKTVAAEFCFQIVAFDPTDAAALGLSRIDADVSSRLASAGYTAPDNASISTILTRADVAVSTRLASASYTAPDNASVTSIKAKTDSLTFTVAGEVNANTRYIQGQEIQGSGTESDPWGP